MSLRNSKTLHAKNAHLASDSNRNLLNRRALIKALPWLGGAAAWSPALLAQNSSVIPVKKLHSFDLRVSDVDRSVKFYQDLFGCPVQARHGDTVFLRIGDGPGFFSLSPTAAGESPNISRIGLSVADFDASKTSAVLKTNGIESMSAPAVDKTSLAVSNTHWLRQRGETSELFFADQEGLVYQLSAEDYCGGSGVLGNECGAIEMPRSQDTMQLIGLSHFTNFVANRPRANDFYKTLFGLSFQAYQGPTYPVVGVGDGFQFLMYVGGDQSGPPENPGRVDHVCFTMADFDVEAVLGRLTNYGLQAREDNEDRSPLLHWISTRFESRGGAPGGTAELYFSDPDGIRIQLQDPSYCGGSGYLGDNCPPLA